jgi:hypothetical protein
LPRPRAHTAPHGRSCWCAAWTIAVLVAASASASVYLYTSVDVGRFGPLPDMYDPTWALPGKRVSALAETVANRTVRRRVGGRAVYPQNTGGQRRCARAAARLTDAYLARAPATGSTPAASRFSY